MKRVVVLLAACALLVTGPAGARSTDRLTIFAAASLTEAFQAFDPNESYSFTGSNTLAAQIKQDFSR